MSASKEITITFPDGTQRTFPAGVTGKQIAEALSPRLAKEALAIKVNGEVRDLNRPIEEDASVQILTWKDPEGKAVYWHSTAHLMAEALEKRFPGIKFGIGPPIEQGFYYDVDLGDRKLSQEDLEEIEKLMRELARRDVPYIRKPVSKEEALAYFRQKGDEYKVELIEELEDGSITFYEQGDFVDLCRGPHLPSTGYIKYPKLLSIAGAYWRGDERRPQLTRIYGISFPKKKELEEYLHRLELARQRDHRKLGRQLELFTFNPLVGPGLPIWLPKGTVLRETLIDFLRNEQIKRGYQPVVTPHIARIELYEKSGHYPYYKDSQFPPMTLEEGQYMLKPMNCPHHIMIYANRPHSYRELPIRLAEFGTVYRYEQSGELNGLLRCRGFTQDDAHIFCRPDQVKEEFKQVINLTLTVLSALGLNDYRVQISLRDPENKQKYVGSDEVWEQAEQAIQEAVQEIGLEATIAEGEAAFYGPKLDFMVRDALGREWQLGTVQVDYNLPERFDLFYVGEDNEKHRPVMIHRAPFGSMERFIGVLIEHTGGNFPTWLAPVQVIVLPISQEFNDYAREVAQQLQEAGLRAEVDLRNEKIGYKIRAAETQKIPYMLIVGKQEASSGTVSVRKHRAGKLGTLPLEAFIQQIKQEIQQVIH